MEKSFKYVLQTACVLVFLVFLSALTFGNNLHGEFMVDDFGLVTAADNAIPEKFSNVFLHFIPNYKVTKKIENLAHSVYYRPLAHILPFMQFLVFGQNAFEYHLCNLVLFALACYCFYLLFVQLTADRRFSLICCVLFCMHPLNGMMVNYITASVYALEMIALSLCVLFYVRSENNGLFLFFALSMFCIAVLCHETALMLPAYLIMITSYQQKSLRAGLKKAWPFCIIVFVYFVLRFSFTSIQESVFLKVGQYTNLTFVSYIATFTKLICWYFERFITLQGMVVIWSTPLIKDFLWAWCMAAAIAVGGVIYLLFKWRNDIKQVYLVWFLLGLPPVMAGCMFLPQTGLMIEPHWLFFASFGLYALLSIGILEIAKRISLSFRILASITLMSILLYASWQNNILWKDELTFTRHWVAMAPTNKNAQFCLGHALFERKEDKEAKKWFLSSLMNQQNDWQNYTNLAAIALRQNDEAQAMAYFEKSLAVFAQSAVTHNNLGVYYLQKNNYDKAQEHFEKANKANPYQVESLLNLGTLAEKRGDWPTAWDFYSRGYDLRPQDERILFSLLRCSLQDHGRMEIIPKAQEFLPKIKDENYLNQLGSLLAIKGHTALSLKYFSKMMKLYPKNLDAYRQMGKVLANEGFFNQAADVWSQGLNVDPNDVVLKQLLKELAMLRTTKNP